MDPKIAQHLLVGAHAFISNQELKEWEGLSREDFVYLINSLFESENFLDSVGLLEKVANEELQASSIPPDLENLINQWENAKEQKQEIREEAERKVRSYIEKRKKSYIPLAEAAKQKPLKIPKNAEEQWQQTNEELTVKIQNQLISFDPSLSQDPELLEKLTEEIKTDLVSLALTSEETEIEKKLAPLINEALAKNGYLINSQKQEALANDLYESSREEIQEIRTTNNSPIPQEVLNNYSQNTENVVFTPAYVLANPSLLVAYSQKALVALPVKFLQNAASETSPEWQKMLKEGIFAENYDLTIKNLISSGLPENHPAVIKLRNERDRLYEAQKTSTGKDKPLVGLLKTFFKPSELTGNQKGASDSTGIAISSKTLWNSGKGWAFNLKGAFNQLGLASKIYQKFPSLPGKTLVTSRFSIGALAWSNRRLWRPVYLTVAKTAAGKTIKVGIKKAAVWLGTRLGLQTAITAAGISTGPGVVVAVVINVGIEIVGFVWNKGIKPFFQKISQWVKNPETAFVALIAGLVVLPISTAVGAALIIAGGVGLIGGIGSILGGLAVGATSLFSALIGAPMAGVPITAFLVTVLGSVGALTFFVVMTTSGAFILPKGMGDGIGGPPLALVPPECQSPRHLSENVLCQLNSCGIQSVTGYNYTLVESCMGNFSNKEAILNQFQASLPVDRCNCLQCVGFVRGVMAALGKDPGGGKDAKDYLDDNVPSGYIKSINMSGITVGDLAVMKSGLYGHIAIVVKRDGNKITVAQAWGGTGAVNMTDFNISQFDGYLRP